VSGAEFNSSDTVIDSVPYHNADSKRDITGRAKTIELISPIDPNKKWKLPIETDILIGRSEKCSVRLSDKSVSREQCRISSAADGKIIVTHLSTTNKTMLNGANVAVNAVLRRGDILKFGRETLKVQVIEEG